jgi:hypothetical protein
MLLAFGSILNTLRGNFFPLKAKLNPLNNRIIILLLR